MTTFIRTIASLFFCLLPSGAYASFVTAHLIGQFGNQLFIMAAAVSLALENGAQYSFPELRQTDHDPIYRIPLNFEKVFYHINSFKLPQWPFSTFVEQGFTYSPIPYKPNMILSGYFQSEKYFKKHKKEIIELFSPQPEIVEYLYGKYQDIIDDPKTVAIHMRTYSVEKYENQRNAYLTFGREYVKKAMEQFPSDTHYIVFSNKMDWCKSELIGLNGNFRFIEGETHYHDFYLMSMCKSQIICNSSFSWWAAYLNRNPDKKVIAPPGWFSAALPLDTRDLIPPEWIQLDTL